MEEEVLEKIADFKENLTLGLVSALGDIYITNHIYNILILIPSTLLIASTLYSKHLHILNILVRCFNRAHKNCLDIK